MMQITPLSLLNSELSSEIIIDIILENDLKIELEIDLHYDDSPDCYWITDSNNGFELSFNDNRRLVTVFCYFDDSSTFAPCALHLDNFDPKTSLSSLINQLGKPDFTSRDGNGIRYDFDTYSVHYKFDLNKVVMVTYMTKDVTPGRRTQY
ncbi:MAG: hypothetical protein ACOCXT_01230 [Candidatus Dojkabacteria bacterium]